MPGAWLREVGLVSGYSAVRRGLTLGVIALVAAVPAIVLGPRVAAATVRIAKVTASPTWVSRFVTPKRVTVHYTQSASAYVTVKVMSSSGALVRTIVNHRYLSAGNHAAYWDLKRSTGSWSGNGKYTIRIYMKDKRGHKSSPYPAIVSTTVDNTKPSATITSVTPTTLSASQSQVTTVTYKLSDNFSKNTLTTRLYVVNSAGTIVRSIEEAGVTQGTGRAFAWNGCTDTGTPMAPGTYSMRVRAQDLAGNIYVSPITVSAKVSLTSWSPERRLDPTPYTQVIMRAETRDDLTHVVWNDGSATGDRIRYRRVDKYGNTVVAQVLVATATLDLTPDFWRGVPDVSADASGGAYVVWRGTGRSTSYKGIWLARIDPAGHVAWSRRILSESDSYAITDPRVGASASGLVHVVCCKRSFPNAIYYASFRSDGNDYVGWTALASGPEAGQRKLPNVVVDAAGRVHIAWYDAIDHPGATNVGKREVYYTRLVYSAGYVNGTGPGGTIDRKRLTTTTDGYSPSFGEAPEMAVDSAGAVHIAWPDDESAKASRGIRYLKLANDGSIAIASRLLFDGSPTTASPRYGSNQAIAALPGGGARVVYRAPAGTTAPDRLWQIDVSSSGVAGAPFCITTSGGSTSSAAQDDYPSLGTDSSGVTHLVFASDAGAPLYQQRVTYMDMAADPASNDRTRGDLEIDAAHVVHVSSPTPPRQNTPVTVQVEVRNAGWVPILGGTAILRFEGTPVGAPVSIPMLSVEGTALVSLPWTVPDDAVDPPADLVVSVAPLGETTQTASTNDTASAPLEYLVPPTETSLLVEVCDETYDVYRTGSYPVATPTVTLSGTTGDGAPYSAVGAPVGSRVEFLHVPLGAYTVSHSKPGYIVSAPTSRAVTVARDPGDRYVLITTPSNLIQLWMNRWGSIQGTAHESVSATPVAGVTVTMLESATTSVTVGNGLYRFARLCEGPITLRVTKPGYERQILTPVISPASTMTLDLSMVATTTGYLVGTVTDEGGQPIVNDPDTTSDDPSVRVKQTGHADRVLPVPGGVLDIRLSAGSYTLEFSAPGYVTVTGVSATIVGGVETDKSTTLDLNVSALTHKKSPRPPSASARWIVSWTMHANWFGSQPPGFKNALPLPSYNIKQWNGLFRFTFDGDYQRRGTSDYIVYVKPWFVGEAWEWTYFYGVDPPVAPLVFKYEQDLLGLAGDKYQPPMLIEGNRWNRTGVRIDGIDIVDQRDGSVVSKIRSEWNSCDSPEGHLYGSVTGAVEGDGPFPAYGHAVPIGDQVVRLWITVGQMTAEGHFAGAMFADLSYFNQGDFMQASGYNRLQLFWRPGDNAMWVQPALVDYPTP